MLNYKNKSYVSQFSSTLWTAVPQEPYLAIREMHKHTPSPMAIETIWFHWYYLHIFQINNGIVGLTLNDLES